MYKRPVTQQPTKMAPPEKILPALVHHYTPNEPGAVLDTRGLIDLLRKLPSLSQEDNIDTIAVLLKRFEPGSSFSKENQAVISFVDDATTAVLKQTDLDFKIESFVRDVAPHIAALALEKNIHAAMQDDPLFTYVDLIIEDGIGWSEDLGILGQQYIEKIEAAVSGFASGRLKVNEVTDQLTKVIRKEEPLFKKLETRLCERELKVLSGKKAQFFSAELLNKQMAGQKLPLFIIFMLQGPWYEFMTQVYTHYGDKSKEWDNVQKISEAMIWSLQPGRDKTKQSSIMTSVPTNIRSFCDKAPFNTDSITAALADLDGEYESIRAGEASDPCDFELMETDEDMASAMQEAARDAVAEIKNIPTDQWFLYDDPKEPDEKVARIKLILNWQETEQVLLTNHNRRKVVHMSYGEMINHLKSAVLRKLSPSRSAADTFKYHLFTVLKAVSDQNKKEKLIEEQKKRRAVSKEYTSHRKETLEEELALLEQRAERKKQRALVLRHKADKKQAVAESTVKSLRQDAWVKLPVMEGTLTPCKLVAIIPANQTYIFANRAGLKIAEYSASQLAHMIVTENSEILDTGAEFESALATVVSGLREDKNKSYSELTGDNS